jgi:hypothetical protein
VHFRVASEGSTAIEGASQSTTELQTAGDFRSKGTYQADLLDQILTLALDGGDTAVTDLRFEGDLWRIALVMACR